MATLFPTAMRLEPILVRIPWTINRGILKVVFISEGDPQGYQGVEDVDTKFTSCFGLLINSSFEDDRVLVNDSSEDKPQLAIEFQVDREENLSLTLLEITCSRHGVFRLWRIKREKTTE